MISVSGKIWTEQKDNIIAQINENVWNNKKSIQLNIKDLIL